MLIAMKKIMHSTEVQTDKQIAKKRKTHSTKTKNSQVNTDKQIAKKRKTHSTMQCNKKEPQLKISLISSKSDNPIKKQSVVADTEVTSGQSLKRKRPQFVIADSNWKALNETLPKKENHLGKYHKKKKLKVESQNGLWKRRGEDKIGDKVWFDDVDPTLLECCNDKKQQENTLELVDEGGLEGLTKHIGVDCEMVGVGYKGQDSILARVSIVNEFGKCVYDKYVKPREKVTDYRTAVSGITPQHIKSGAEFKDVQKEVADIFKDRIIVGHALSNDLKVLFLGHPRKKTRDTSDYKPFRRLNRGSKPSLKKLAELVLNRSIQTGQHDSIEDARVAMKLYMLNRKDWEKSQKLKGSLTRRFNVINDTQSIEKTKAEKRRKIKLFKMKNSQKKRR